MNWQSTRKESWNEANRNGDRARRGRGRGVRGVGPAPTDRQGPARRRPRPRSCRRFRRTSRRASGGLGVKCDAPPFGYIDVRGQNAGFDVEIAHWFARYAFGRENRVSFTCAPTAAREPLLTSDRVDLVISTFTYTADRDTRIDFSRAYYKATGRLLVKNDSPVQALTDLKGKQVATTSGSIYDRWMKKCFTDTGVTVTDSFTNALLAFNQGRADALMWDDTVLVGVAAADRTAKLTGDTFLALPYGIGIKQGNIALKRWVDSRLELMRKKDSFLQILKNNVPARFVHEVLEEHPAAEQHLRVRAAARRARTPCARSSSRAVGSGRGARPPSCASCCSRHLRPLGVRLRELRRAPGRLRPTLRCPRSRSSAPP